MSNFREVSDNDLLGAWFDYREQEVFCLLTEEDKKHKLKFDEVYQKIMNGLPKQYQKFVSKQLEDLDENFTDYIVYWTEKYYRNGFCDGVEMIGGCLEK